MNEHKRGEHAGIQSYKELLIKGPVREGRLDHRPIPLARRNCLMMESAREAAHATGGEGGSPLLHFGPRRQRDRTGEYHPGIAQASVRTRRTSW